MKLGLPDVDALLDGITDEQFNEFKALAIIDGWYQGDWQHTAEIMATFHNCTRRQIIANAAKPDSAARAIPAVSATELVDALTFSKTKSNKGQSPEMAKKQLKVMYG